MSTPGLCVQSADIAPIIGAVGGLITVVGGFTIQVVMMLKQTKKIDDHFAQTRNDIAQSTGMTGTQKALGS